ncbi:glycoside hydrolase superfamily [Umbelopsis sp. PMI_123]|nr:glycoside hydrolase superfamily [Umbelopsis sp. PMI_123]
MSTASRNLIIILYILQALCSAAVIKREGTAWNFWREKAWGANIGNWLVLERWIEPSLFERHAPNANDEWTFCQEADNASEILKEHWRNWVTEDDFPFIPSIAGEPYVTRGQTLELERILGYCAKYDINAIIVFHGLPGSQNGGQHSGHGGDIKFYQRDNYIRSLTAVQAAVDWMNELPYDLKSRISPIEPINELQVRDDRAFRILWNYYKSCYDIIHQSQYQVPMIFSDGWKSLDDWRGLFPNGANALIDSHIYLCI